MPITVDGRGSAGSGRLRRYVRNRLRATAVWPPSGAYSPGSQPAATWKPASYGVGVQSDASGRLPATAIGINNIINDDAESGVRCPARQYDTNPARRLRVCPRKGAWPRPDAEPVGGITSAVADNDRRRNVQFSTDC